MSITITIPVAKEATVASLNKFIKYQDVLDISYINLGVSSQSPTNMVAVITPAKPNQINCHTESNLEAALKEFYTPKVNHHTVVDMYDSDFTTVMNFVIALSKTVILPTDVNDAMARLISAYGKN